MSREGGRESGLGSVEWALATIATVLAEGTPSRITPMCELAEAAGTIVGALRGAGTDLVLLPSGVWDLRFLSEAEGLDFAREAAATLFERLHVRIVWKG